MTEEQQAAYIMGLSSVLYATVSGMNAENIMRQSQGGEIAYTEKDFENAIDVSGVHHNAIITLFQDL